MKIKFYRAYVWILLGLLAVLIKSLTADHPEWIEQYYSLGLYQWIRSVFDYSLSYFPFPAIYFFFAIILLSFGQELVELIQNIRKKTWSFSRSLRKTVGFIGGLVFFFFAWKLKNIWDWR